MSGHEQLVLFMERPAGRGATAAGAVIILAILTALFSRVLAKEPVERP